MVKNQELEAVFSGLYFQSLELLGVYLKANTRLVGV